MFFELLETLPYNEAIERCVPQLSFMRKVASKVLLQRSKDFFKKSISL
jgi:hypothetical protein